jgi:flagellar biosynthetic protein FliQ
MSSALAVDLVRQAVMLCLLVAAPALLTALAVGIGVSLLQAVTQIQEQTLTFIPKLLCVALVMVLALPWSLARLVEYLAGVLRGLPTLTP